MRRDASDATGLRQGDFAIGLEFQTATGRWRCTDVGTRTIVAIKVSDHQDDPSWFDGPPYAVAEVVFDENDLKGCWHLRLTEGSSIGGGAMTKQGETLPRASSRSCPTTTPSIDMTPTGSRGPLGAASTSKV